MMMAFNPHGGYNKPGVRDYSWDQQALITELTRAADAGTGIIAMKTCLGGPYSPDEIQKINLRLQNASTLTSLEASSFSASIGKFESGEVEKIEQFFNLLESYTKALSDPKKNLRDIAPLIKSIESEKEKLAGLGESLPDGDILKDIVNQAAILANVEVLKFNRGDYL